VMANEYAANLEANLLDLLDRINQCVRTLAALDLDVLAADGDVHPLAELQSRPLLDVTGLRRDIITRARQKAISGQRDPSESSGRDCK
jgi:hypothetical protein